ncbi:hypothetical protein [uncultured Psychroserpens sp.]|uniref:hypothetical protein n=1 Tax=uncultured Psychroserpens sp. TaxID=255436 RepID=UPI00260C535D|nr:hypothetical protein [uncultured Psychroserpens sp.]
MKLQLLLTTFLLCSISLTVKAQDFEIPKDVTLNTAEDYKKYNQDVINGINWLENTPINEKKTKRQNASAFLMLWMTGSPTVSIEVSSYVIPLIESNPDLLMTFLGGWTKYAIENPDDSSAFNGNLAGLKSLIEVYKKNKETGIEKERAIEKLIKLKSDEDLEKWLKKKLKN